MKTFRQFCSEAKGFKDAMGRKRKKKEFLTPRERKIQKLRNRASHWEGLR